jgi:hypothetical protein
MAYKQLKVLEAKGMPAAENDQQPAEANTGRVDQQQQIDSFLDFDAGIVVEEYKMSLEKVDRTQIKLNFKITF